MPPSFLRRACAAIWSCAPLLLAACCLLFASGFVIGRAVRNDVDPLDVAFYRWSLGAVLIAAIARRTVAADLAELRRHWRTVLLLAASGIAGASVLAYRGLQSTTAINSLLVQSSAPLLILAVTLLAYRERPTPKQVLAILVSFAGVAVIALHGHLSWADLVLNGGDAWIVAGTLCVALYTVLLRRRPNVRTSSLLLALFAAGALLLLPFVAWTHAHGSPALPSVGALLAIAYLAVFTSVLAYLFLNRGIELIGPSRAGHYAHLIPLFGSVLAVLFLGEQLQAYHGAGAALIAAGLLMANWPARAGHGRTAASPRRPAPASPPDMAATDR